MTGAASSDPAPAPLSSSSSASASPAMTGAPSSDPAPTPLSAFAPAPAPLSASASASPAITGAPSSDPAPTPLSASAPAPAPLSASASASPAITGAPSSDPAPAPAPLSAEENLHLAILAEEAKRYDDMFKFMKDFVIAVYNDADAADLTVEERGFLACACYQAVNKRRKARFSLVYQTLEGRTVDLPKDRVNRILEYRLKIDEELLEICENTLSLLDDYLLPAVERKDSQAFYLKMKGDFHQYVAEVEARPGWSGDDDPSPKYLEEVNAAREAYEDAQYIVENLLEPIDPVRLEVVDAFAQFYCVFLKLLDKGINLAQKALDAANVRLGRLQEQADEHGAFMMPLDGDFYLNKDLMMQLRGEENIEYFCSSMYKLHDHVTTWNNWKTSMEIDVAGDQGKTGTIKRKKVSFEIDAAGDQGETDTSSRKKISWNMPSMRLMLTLVHSERNIAGMMLSLRHLEGNLTRIALS